MSGSYLALAIVGPLLVALAIALPFWLKHQYIVGTTIGMIIVFGAALLIVGAEYTELERLRAACVEADVPCPSVRTADAFTRLATYALIALAQSFLLFIVSGMLEDRARSRPFDSRWR